MIIFRHIFIILLLNFCVCSVFSQHFVKGKVVKVSDGDTLTILDSTNTQIRVRLYGIDCPEHGQDFSNVAKKFTSDHCFAKIDDVEVRDIDRYGRTVGIVLTPDSVNVNLALLQDGLAWHYKYYDKSEEFAKAELDARTKKRGLWVQPNAKPPWEYRRNW